MTENQDPTPDPEPAGDGGARYAAYNDTLQRFVGDVVTSKRDAAGQDAVKAAKDAGDKITIRKV